MAIDRQALTAQYERAIDHIEEAVRACPDDQWYASLWPVPRTDPWVWPQPGTEPVAERTEESLQRFSAFAVVVYHTLWFLDFYSTVDPASFDSPDYVKGGPEELGFASDGAVAVPMLNDATSRDALLRYAAHGRSKIRDVIASVTDDQLEAVLPSGHPRAGESFERVLHVTLEHLHEHGAQLAACIPDGAP